MLANCIERIGKIAVFNVETVGDVEVETDEYGKRTCIRDRSSFNVRTAAYKTSSHIEALKQFGCNEVTFST